MNKLDLTSDVNFSQYCNGLGIKPIIQDKVTIKPQSISKFNAPYQAQEVNYSAELLCLSEGFNEYCNDGQKLVIKNLRNNKYKIIAKIDLHGQTTAQASKTLETFLNNHQTLNNTCLKIIHGKGHHSQFPVLKNLVRKYLENYPRLLAYSTANNSSGGDGVTLIKLKN